MNCEQCKNMMDASIHGELSGQQQRQLEVHLSACEHCREEHEWMSSLIAQLQSEFPEVTPPPQLHDRLMARLEQEEKPNIINRWIPLASAAVILLAVFVGASALFAPPPPAGRDSVAGDRLNGTMAIEEYGYDGAAPAATPVPMPQGENELFVAESMPQASEAPQAAAGAAEDQGRSAAELPASERKLIKNANLYIETQTFDDAVEQLSARATGAGGYVQTLNVSGLPLDENNPGNYGRSAYMDVRIPAEQLEAFLAQARTYGKVVDSSQGGSDVTQVYEDLTARLNSYTVQRDRLLAIMEKADKVEDLILLESELSRVQYEIESYTRQITDIDRRVAESTVTINLTEVRSATRVRPADPSLGGRIREGFIATINALWMGIQNLLVWLVAHSPIIISVLAILATLWFWLRKRRMP